MTDVFDDFRVIDVDTHLTEPPDVWTARVSSKWGDLIPHVERHDGVDGWVIGGNRAIRPGFVTMAGFDGTFPQHPKTFEDFPMASYDASARLEHLNATGIYAQVLYPNVGGFGSQVFLKLGEPELMLECVRAYNEFLIDWTSVAPNRLIPVMALPFWNLGGVSLPSLNSQRLGATVQFCSPVNHKTSVSLHYAIPIGILCGRRSRKLGYLSAFTSVVKTLVR